MGFEQVRVNPELHSSIHLDYHIGSRVVIAIELSLA